VDLDAQQGRDETGSEENERILQERAGQDTYTHHSAVPHLPFLDALNVVGTDFVPIAPSSKFVSSVSSNAVA
jgi:hypothetical protein